MCKCVSVIWCDVRIKIFNIFSYYTIKDQIITGAFSKHSVSILRKVPPSSLLSLFEELDELSYHALFFIFMYLCIYNLSIILYS